MSEVMTKWHSLIEAASWKNCWSCKNLFTICDERRSAKEDGAQEPEHIDICEESGQSAPSFNIQRVYLKDLSVEQPNSPDIFLELETPAVEVEINITVSRLA